MARVQDGDVLEVKPRRHYKTSLIWYCCGASWSAASYGFGASIMATTIGQPSFLREMQLDTTSNASELIGAANAIYFIGGFVGTLLTAIFADRYGRKPVIAAGAVIMLLSTAVLAGSVHMSMFICFRFFAGVGGYMALTAGPLLIAELVPPKHRGILLDINPIFTNIGYTSASWIGVGFFFYKNGDSWRGPIAIGCLPCILSLISIYFVPESPRYLVLKDKAGEAWEVVRNLHITDGDDSFARREFEHLSVPRSLKESTRGNNTEVCHYQMDPVNATSNAGDGDDAGASCNGVLSDKCQEALRRSGGPFNGLCPSMDIEEECGKPMRLWTSKPFNFSSSNCSVDKLPGVALPKGYRAFSIMFEGHCLPREENGFLEAYDLMVRQPLPMVLAAKIPGQNKIVVEIACMAPDNITANSRVPDSEFPPSGAADLMVRITAMTAVVVAGIVGVMHV